MNQTEKQTQTDKQWYVIHTYSGQEDKVRKSGAAYQVHGRRRQDFSGDDTH